MFGARTHPAPPCPHQPCPSSSMSATLLQCDRSVFHKYVNDVAGAKAACEAYVKALGGTDALAAKLVSGGGPAAVCAAACEGVAEEARLTKADPAAATPAAPPKPAAKGKAASKDPDAALKAAARAAEKKREARAAKAKREAAQAADGEDEL